MNNRKTFWQCCALCVLSIQLMLVQSCGQEVASESFCQHLEGLESIEGIQCGVLKVPENHDAPDDSRMLQIAYAILPAKVPDSNLAPMVFLSGGPGNASLTTAQVKNWLSSDLRSERDIILFDQRGIGLSSALPNMLNELYDIMGANTSLEEESESMRRLFEVYATKAQENDIDLALYNTFQSARDVGALMAHLDYEKYNLYGVSYGTRLARAVQELFPSYLNAVVLNSPDPIRGDFLMNRLRSYSLALERVLHHCDNNETCKAAYPDLRSDYYKLLRSLQEEPVKVSGNDGSFFINAQDGVYFIRRALYATNSRNLVPRLIRELSNGGGSIIESMVANEFWASYNFSMWLSVERYEMYDKSNTAAVVDDLYEQLPLLPVKLAHFTTIYDHLDLLHGGSLSKKEKELSLSVVPTLIFVNQFDPVTPTENGQILMEKLENGQLLILDEGGHGGGNAACRSRVMTHFMDNPVRDLDTSCLNIYKP